MLSKTVNEYVKMIKKDKLCQSILSDYKELVGTYGLKTFKQSITDKDYVRRSADILMKQNYVKRNNIDELYGKMASNLIVTLNLAKRLREREFENYCRDVAYNFICYNIIEDDITRKIPRSKSITEFMTNLPESMSMYNLSDISFIDRIPNVSMLSFLELPFLEVK
jgi:hypothetical protein